MTIDCKTLVFGGGGVNGFAYTGVLETIFKDNVGLNDVTTFIGTSIGSIIASILACGGNNEFIERTIGSINVAKLEDHSYFYTKQAYDLIFKFGHNKGGLLLKTIEDVLEELTQDRNITFKKLYDIRKVNLVITATNISRGCLVYFNRLTDPDLRIADACRMSSSVPLFFRPDTYKGDLYVDGMLIANYPIDFIGTDMFKLLNNYSEDVFDQNNINSDDLTKRPVDIDTALKNLYGVNDRDTSEYFVKNILNRTIGIKAYDPRSLRYIDNKENPSLKFNIMSYIESIIDMSLLATIKAHITEGYWARSVKIDIGDIDPLDFDLTADKIHHLKQNGINAANIFLNKTDQ